MQKRFKPGLQFETTVPKLCKKYKDIDTVFRHMSMGQLSNHIERDGCIYHLKKGLIYNSKTGEIYDV